jgi:competence protein ComEC
LTSPSIRLATFAAAALTLCSTPSGAPVSPAALTLPPRIVIGRVMADPRSVSDEHGEWFEVHNLGTSGVPLRGWRIASRNDAGHTITRAVIIPPGGQVVLGRDADRTRNGGIRVDYAYGSAITLANSGDWLAVHDARGTTVDSVSWTSTSGGFAHVQSNRIAPVPNARAGAPAVARDSSQVHERRPERSPTELVVRVLDVGQGDATLITNGTSTVLIDGGPDASRFGFLLDSLGLDGTTIDVVILSHQHYDHHAGLRELFRSSRAITVRYFFENQDPYTNAALSELRDSIAARADRGALIYRDTDDPCGDGRALCTVTMNGGARLHVMRPYPSGVDPNDRSAPVKLVGPDSASFTMWFAGDAEHSTIAWFESARYDVMPGMQVDVLKADHHGSCNGVSSWYLRTTRPKWLAVSVGADNSYGHMHVQAKQMYTSFRVPWYRTDLNGTIEFRSPGTRGGGFTVVVGKGSSSMDGSADRRSTQPDCNPIP